MTTKLGLIRLIIATITGLAILTFLAVVDWNGTVEEGDYYYVSAGLDWTDATDPPATAEALEVTTSSSASTTTIIAPTTTAITAPAGAWQCPHAIALAVTVGWPTAELATLDAIIWRESRCDGRQHNTEDPASGSRGLLQINGYWCHTTRWLQDAGVLQRCADLFDDVTSLRAGLTIWNNSGWNPWGGRP